MRARRRELWGAAVGSLGLGFGGGSFEDLPRYPHTPPQVRVRSPHTHRRRRRRGVLSRRDGSVAARTSHTRRRHRRRREPRRSPRPRSGRSRVAFPHMPAPENLSSVELPVCPWDRRPGGRRRRIESARPQWGFFSLNMRKDKYMWRYNTDDISEEVLRTSTALENMQLEYRTIGPRIIRQICYGRNLYDGAL